MRIGIEIEFTGITLLKAATEVANVLGGSVKTEEYLVVDETRTRYVIEADGQKWYICRDASIRPEGVGVKESISGELYQCELVSPVVNVSSIFDTWEIYRVLRRLRVAGAKVNSSCGIHIHIDYIDEVRKLKAILLRVMKNQQSISEYFNIPAERAVKYCKTYSLEFIREFENAELSTVQDLCNFFYNRLGEGMHRFHPKNKTRYYIVNVASILQHGTIEFRFFNSVLYEGELAEYFKWVIDIVNE